MRLALFLSLLLTASVHAERRLIIAITEAPQFKPDEALFFITDSKETTVTRTLAVPGGAIGGSEWRFAAVYRGDDDKISYKVVVVGEHGELLARGPIEVLTTSLRSLEESAQINPRIAELRSQLEGRKAELFELTSTLEKRLAERGEDPIVKQIESAKMRLSVLQNQEATLSAEVAGRKEVLNVGAETTPRGFQTRLSTLTTEIQALATLASQAERSESKRLPAAKVKLDEALALVNDTKGESLAALEAELAKLQKMQPR